MIANRILTINGGSSSIKFAVFDIGKTLTRALVGKLDRIGCDGTQVKFSCQDSSGKHEVDLAALDHVGATEFLMDWLTSNGIIKGVSAIGHRIVHGMQRTQPEIVNSDLLNELRRVCPYAPEHVPAELSIIESIRNRLPNVPQVVCFDTAFHRTMPRVATVMAIPRRYESAGIQRYGFHGLSYAYLVRELRRIGDSAATTGRVILAHLGNGASMAAVVDGICIDTSMGFTPASGLPMGTRSGDIDPGVFRYLTQQEGLDAGSLHRMLNHESGLQGVSETSSDMRDLLAAESSDQRAAEAVNLFCYQAKKFIGGYAAAMGGVDTLVFSGGVGENSAEIRRRICDGLAFLGIDLNPSENLANAALISTTEGHVAVRVVPTDEEVMIAHSVAERVPALQT
ncbi:Acetate kinase [Roseimaritima multifibrata]|uniref:Acetate kinase n=1 Tax=Roseimaritima multifibrata TaxID=1930274 RepID=A0A517MGG2_9BACT|nr:acetate/propionate family kinase [Roseimaritima multifibrata]QDS93971.1 Acetate kinase [Roseimaritima multifibrata]